MNLILIKNISYLADTANVCNVELGLAAFFQLLVVSGFAMIIVLCFAIIAVTVTLRVLEEFL